MLRNCESPARLKKALQSLPKTLYETYDRILLNIDEEHRRDALRMLQWLAFSLVTISLEQGVEVLATDPDADDGLLFDPGRRPWDPRQIVHICSSLVTTFKSDIDPYTRTTPTRLRLAHFSVREYLISDYLRQCDDTLSFFHFDPKIADTTIAKTCLAYLLQFTQHGCINSSTKTSYPLSEYAAQYWMYHAWSDNGDSDDLHRLIMDLLQDKDAMYTNWLTLREPFHWVSRHDFAPLYYTSMGGLRKATECLLESSKVNACRGLYGHELQVASSGGHDNIVRLLLEKGADVNMETGYYGSALQAASLNGDDSIIRLLLEKGAEVNMQGGRYGNALQAASLRGHESIVRLLLEKGADVNMQGGEDGSALQAASSHGHNSIFHLLLEKGADINMRGGTSVKR